MRAVTVAAGAFGITMLGPAVAPTFVLELVAFVLVSPQRLVYVTQEHNAAVRHWGHEEGVLALWAGRLHRDDSDRRPHDRPCRMAALVGTTLAIYPCFRATELRHPLGVGNDQLRLRADRVDRLAS